MPSPLQPYSVQARHGGNTVWVWTMIERSIPEVVAKVAVLMGEAGEDFIPPVGIGVGVPPLILEIRSP